MEFTIGKVFEEREILQSEIKICYDKRKQITNSC